MSKGKGKGGPKHHPDSDLSAAEVLEAVKRSREHMKAKAERLGLRADELRDRRGDLRQDIEAASERIRKLERRVAKQKRKDLWRTRDCIDGATTWLGLTLVLAVVELRTAWNGGVNAADRTEAHADDCGNKMSQAELYHGFVAGLPGFYPANPPGVGSHEGIADDELALIFDVPIGAKLPAWAWGLDLSDGPGFEDGAEQLGFKVARPYDNEAWHVNLTENPTAALKKLGVV